MWAAAHNLPTNFAHNFPFEFCPQILWASSHREKEAEYIKILGQGLAFFLKFP